MTEVLSLLRGKIRDRKENLSQYEFDASTPRVRRSRHNVDYCARFSSLEVLNRCFHRSAITDADLKIGKFTVTAKFVDFTSGEVNLQAVDVRVPVGSTLGRLSFSTIFEAFCDATEELVEGHRCTVDDNGGNWPVCDLPGLSHDSRVHARRDMLNRSLKWVTMQHEELLDVFRMTGHYQHEQYHYSNSISDFGMDTHLALLIFIFDFRNVSPSGFRSFFVILTLILVDDSIP